MLAAAGGLIAYLDHVGRGKLPLLLPPVARAGSASGDGRGDAGQPGNSRFAARAGGAAA
jgi:hypothetical protein